VRVTADMRSVVFTVNSDVDVVLLKRKDTRQVSYCGQYSKVSVSVLRLALVFSKVCANNRTLRGKRDRAVVDGVIHTLRTARVQWAPGWGGGT